MFFPINTSLTLLTIFSEKCEKLVDLAREHDVLIICDDVYNTLSYKQDPCNPSNFLPSPQRLYAYDCKNHRKYKGDALEYYMQVYTGYFFKSYEFWELAVKVLGVNKFLSWSGRDLVHLSERTFHVNSCVLKIVLCSIVCSSLVKNNNNIFVLFFPFRSVRSVPFCSFR